MITRIFKISSTIALFGIIVISAWHFYSSNEQAESAFMQGDSRAISIKANYVSYENVDQLDQEADLILIGTPTKNFHERKHVSTYFDDGTLQDFYTLTEIKINKIIKSPNDFRQVNSLTVIEPVGIVKYDNKKVKIKYEEYTELHEGEKNIIFLKKNSFGEYGVINMDFGKFSLEQNSIKHDYTKVEPKEKFRQAILKKYDLTN